MMHVCPVATDLQESVGGRRTSARCKNIIGLVFLSLKIGRVCICGKLLPWSDCSIEHGFR
uniref:Uncharacterized protein n=1 Tax=Parascaris equorum TaxID=6256 RepID=A0A914RH14_PAREQ